MTRLVIFTSGTLGDHLPYLALAQGLQARGHDVLMVINQAMHQYAERAGLPAVAISDIERGPEEARENAWAWDHWRNPWHRAAEHPNATARAPETFIKQIRELSAFLDGADLLLATAIRPHGLAAHLVTGLPWMTLSVNPFSFHQPPLALERQQQAAVERMHYSAMRPLIDRAVREAGGRRLTPDWYRGCLWSPQLILGSSPHFSRPDEDFLRPYTTVDQAGFWYWEDPAWQNWQPSPELEAFAARSPLVLAFSSQPLEEPRDILQKHVWAAAQVGLPLIVQRGWAGFSEDDLPPDADATAVKFIDYAPHDWLFARAAVVIQHGGIGSLARALRQFRPVIVEPFGNDQFYNAGRMAALGAGIAFHPFEATVDGLAAAIEQTQTRRMRLRARSLGRELRDEDGIGSAVTLIERVLEDRASGRRSRFAVPLRSQSGEPPPAAAERAIPKLIHQQWKDEMIPERFQAWHESWRKHHVDWEYRLWTDAMCRALIADHYDWFLPIYDAYTDEIKRVDAARYFILYHHGGLYVDLDYEAFRSLEPLLDGAELLLTEEPPLHLQTHASKLFLDKMLSNALMASRPGHLFWEHVFELLVGWCQAPGPLDATGPFLLSRAYKSFGSPEMITLAPHQQLCPTSSEELWPSLSEEMKQLVLRDAYAIHHWYGSWWIEPIVGEKPALVRLMINGQAQLDSRQVTREALLSRSAGQIERPFVSCLMVTRQRALLAQLAIKTFLKQSYANRELIVIDDGPDDALEHWIAENEDPLVRYYRLSDDGRPLGELRTLALEKARGDYIAQWDDDDLSAPLRLELQMAALAQFGARACLLARELIWVPSLGTLAKSPYRLWEGSAILPRDLVSGFPALRRGEDTAVVEQVAANERIVLLDMPELYVYTFHGGNTFELAHWLKQIQQATIRYDGFRYEPALQALQGWLGVNLENLGAYLLSGITAVAPGKPEAPAAGPEAAEADDQFVESTSAGEDELPEILILTPVKDAAPYLAAYLANLAQLDYPAEKLSVGFLESDSRDDTAAMLAGALPQLQQRYRRAVLMRRDYGLHLGGPRWEPGVQRLRRGKLSRSRNALMQAALQDEKWVLWIDVDVAEWPPDIIQQLLASGKRIVVPNCLQAQGDAPFDLNSYQLAPEAESLDWSPYMIDGLLQPPQGFGRLYLTDLRDQDLVRLDGVGGTMLLVDADLHRDGLIFPSASYNGFVDTEGLAVMARDMGVLSWGLPNVTIRHS